MPLLSVENLWVSYGAIQALRGISFHVDEGEVVTLIGGNGAGKSTTLRTISGLRNPSQGTIQFDGQSIKCWPPHRIVQNGLVHVPEGRGIFANLTVEENLKMGAYARHDANGIRSDHERALVLLPRLRERLNQQAGTLSGGEQQMLAIGRALMAKPRLLLLDEPSMGLAPNLVDQVLLAIQALKERGLTVLLVEQNARAALSIADRAYVMETGSITLSGAAGAIQADPRVKEAYLGI